jgi:hypothetical protein
MTTITEIHNEKDAEDALDWAELQAVRREHDPGGGTERGPDGEAQFPRDLSEPIMPLISRLDQFNEQVGLFFFRHGIVSCNCIRQRPAPRRTPPGMRNAKRPDVKKNDRLH